jgi:muramoyltetrapeptide carboxypeptidase LdcA involved in peptidoglycan recycling
MMNGKSANFDRRLAKLENSKLGVPANLAGFRIRKITVREGDDVNQVIKDMEARGEIQPVPADFPAGHISTIVHTIVDWPKRDR